ncbi:tetratricopeptide repeat protein, partial [Planktotalea sp.]|uniref:tetratricopeptide repeat protein n=1 Tax=Planktotalea sp. TaxID=2029877 RepID=UPI003296D36D
MIQTALENGKYEVIGLLKSRRAKQAARLAKTLVTKSPKDPSLRFLSGLVCLSQDNKTMAAKHFSNAIKLGSKDVAAFTNLATLQMSMKASKAADKTLALAVKTFGDDNFQVLHLMAMLRMEEGQTAEALELAEKCIALEGTRVEAWVFKGRILRSQGHLFDAIESFQTAMSLAPDSIDSLVNLSWLFAFTNQNEEALRITEDAVKCLPNSMNLRAQLAQRYTEAGRFDDAIEMFHSLCGTPEYRPMALRVLAQISPEGALPDLIARAAKAVRTTKDAEALGQLHLAMHMAHQRSAASDAKKLSLGTANGFLARARPYSSQDDEAYHAAIKATYDAEMEVSAGQSDRGAPVPI